MPRRKKAVLSHLPSLVFVNSPDFIPAPVLTPDLAVENPVTARAVPIENLTENVWVSPQFRALHEKQYRCQSNRRTNHCLSHVSADTRQETESGRSLKSCKFKPLQFLNDNSKKLGEQIICVSELSVCRESNEDEGSLRCNVCRTNHEGSLSNDVGINLEDINNIIVHTPALIGECCTISPEHNNHISKSSCSIQSTSNVRKGIGGKQTLGITPRRVVHTGNAVQHGLLKPKNLFSESTSVNSNVPKQSAGINNHSDSLQDFRQLVSFNTCGTTNMKSSKCSFEDPNKTKSRSVSNQISEHISHSVHINTSTSISSPEIGGQAVLLVVDTPQGDYGLTFRQRQLKYRLT